ncbi:MAG: cytochrome c-type biogenesis protein [Candidatus Tokpelaia sp. JSC085]|nr:MAG: cytochrome c-type biogenesis protein [Candidatus Tokpelaia sp. JSC085]
MAIEISWPMAAGAGMLSFISPCVLPLVPLYLCYMAGVSVEDLRSRSRIDQKKQIRHVLFPAAFLFVFAFTLAFVTLGAGVTAIGSFLFQWKHQIAAIAGFIIILMGLNFLGLLHLSVFSREARFQISNRKRPDGLIGAFIMGLAFAFGWTPCIGPILGPILTLASSKETISEGMLLLILYSLGLGIPFILASLFSGAFMHFLHRVRIHLGKVEKIIGLLLIISGILFMSGDRQNAFSKILETFPNYF